MVIQFAECINNYVFFFLFIADQYFIADQIYHSLFNQVQAITNKAAIEHLYTGFCVKISFHFPGTHA